jgi:PmbA protein
MNIKKFFEKAAAAGITSCQLRVSSSTSTSISLFHHEIDSYSIENDQSLVATGVYQGKVGICNTQKIDNSSFDFLIQGIINNASKSEKTDSVDIFPGSPKYKKKSFFAKELAETPITEKIDLIKEIENDLFAYSDEISDVQGVSYSESSSTGALYNSYGLKLKAKDNYFFISAGVVAKRGDEVKTAGDYEFGTDIKAIDKKAFVNGICERAIKQFGGVQCPAGKYPTLLDRDVFGSLLSYFLAANSADEVQRKSSFLTGLEGKRVASNKVTIDEKPLLKGPLYTYYDAEGVARSNKRVVNHGILLTHFYNRETAKKAGRETTAHGSYGAGKIGIGTTNIIVRPSKLPLESLIKDIKEGVYITEVAGLGTGMNVNSGDFSCQAQGYMIRGGKIAEPLDLITLAGNVLKMLRNVKGFDDRFRLQIGVSCSDALIKEMSIGGKN